MMLNGPIVLLLACTILVVLWIIVLYGSTFFGAKTD
jgi:hypothetical protein